MLLRNSYKYKSIRGIALSLFALVSVGCGTQEVSGLLPLGETPRREKLSEREGKGISEPASDAANVGGNSEGPSENSLGTLKGSYKLTGAKVMMVINGEEKDLKIDPFEKYKIEPAMAWESLGNGAYKRTVTGFQRIVFQVSEASSYEFLFGCEIEGNMEFSSTLESSGKVSTDQELEGAKLPCIGTWQKGALFPHPAEKIHLAATNVRIVKTIQGYDIVSKMKIRASGDTWMETKYTLKFTKALN